MLKLATLIENPGEPAVQSRYHDFDELRTLGYNALAIYETTGISGLENAEVISSTELKRWVQNHFDRVDRTIEQARAADLDVYLFYDALVLARDVVERDVNALTCRHRPNTLCPASDRAIELSLSALESILLRWPGIAGVVYRFGDTDADRLPYLVGNDIYSPHCPRCSQFGRADRITTLLERVHGVVVGQHGKRLIARAWNLRPNGIHDSTDLARRVIERLPAPVTAPDPESKKTAGDGPAFMLSFKFTQTDFWRYQKWNPSSLVAGDVPIIYELQCQREFEGKGGLPNWQLPLWRDGYPESVGDGAVRGLAEAVDRVNLAGLWAWVRGGGWGGPFIKDETWVDANVFAVPRLADNPKADVAGIGRQWIDERLSLDTEAEADLLMDILERSPEFVCQAFYIGPFAASKADPWHPNADWIQDDVLDADSAWRMIQRLPESKLDEVIAEKAAAVDRVANCRARLHQLLSDRDHHDLERLGNTLSYAESFFEALRDLLAGLIAYRRYQKTRTPAARELTRSKLFAAQTHWNHHVQRFGSLPGAATAFRESHFWDLTQDILGEVG